LPLLAALGILDDGVGWCCFATIRDRFPPPETGSGSAASMLSVYWAARLSSSSVVHLKMLFGAWKGDGCRASLMPLLDAFGPGPLGPWPCPSRHGLSLQHCAACPHPPGEPSGAYGVPH
jgi:hypothetical protein